MRALSLLFVVLSWSASVAASETPAAPASADQSPVAARVSLEGLVRNGSGAAVESGIEQTDLLRLFCEARHEDPNVLAARYRAQAGAERQREAMGSLLPQVSGNLQFNRTRRSGPDVATEYYNTKRYTLSLSQQIYNKAAWENYQKFKYMAQQSQLETEDIQAEAAVDLAQRYFAALAADDELALVQAELASTRKNADRAQAMLRVQRIAKTEALQLEARVNTLVAMEVEAANQSLVARQSLMELVGRPVTEPLSRIRENLELQPPIDNMDDWVQRALLNNKGLQARRYAVDAASAAVREGRGMHYPSVSLNLSSQRSDVGYDNVLAPKTDSLIASVNVNVPLYSGGSISARVRGLQADRLGAEQQLEALRRQLISQSTGAYLTTQASIAKVQALRLALDAAIESREASEHMFERALVSAVDVLDTVQAEYRARRDLLQTHYEFMVNLLVLNRWAGDFSQQNVQDLNRWLEPSGADMAGTQVNGAYCND